LRDHVALHGMQPVLLERIGIVSVTDDQLLLRSQAKNNLNQFVLSRGCAKFQRSSLRL
jgi:hypothetical protein